MKLLLVGDLHLRLRTPEGRTDDFAATQYDKLEQILNLAAAENCTAILQAGDFFDSPNPANYLMARTIGQFKEVSYPVRTVLGQHDMYLGSTDPERTALNVLAQAGAVQFLGNIADGMSGICFYGVSFGSSTYPVVLRRRGDTTFNVLVMHAPFGYPLFEGHKIQEPEELFDKFPYFDLIFVGDYHYRFLLERDGRYVINAGAVVRLTRSERDRAHRPAVVIFDTDARTTKVTELDFAPAEDIFDMADYERDEERKETLTRFVESLQGASVGVDFGANLQAAFKKNKTGAAVRQRIGAAMEEVGVSDERGKGR